MKKKLAVILGAGGSRGFANIGVLKIIEKLKITPHLIVGSSMGAIIGALYADGKSAEELETILLKTNIFSFVEKNIMLGHLLSTQKTEEFLEKHLRAKTFSQLNIPLKVNATNVNTQKEKIFSKGLIIPAILASIALPGLYKPYLYKNEYLIDGGVTNPVPLNIAPENYNQIVIDVSFTAKLINSQSSTKELFFRTFYLLQQASQKYYTTVKYSKDNSIVFIKPNLGVRNAVDFRDKQKIITKGENAARKKLKSLQKIKEEYIK